MSSRADVVIVGAGHGGAAAAVALRQRGFAGTVAMVSAEPDPPYERPPLSKEYLAGERAFERMLIRPAGFWQERGIALMGARRVVAVDPRAREIGFEDGVRLGYGALVWAAGGRARRLRCEGGELEGVHVIRTRADVDRIRAALPAVERVAIVGGGYIGLEAAAVLSTLGKRVVVLEAQARLLSRVAGEAIGRFYEAEHRARGVEVRTGAMVSAIEGAGGRVERVRLADGGAVEAGLVIAGIGIEPVVEPLAAAGAACGDGVLVDAGCWTSLPDVYAVGDCAAHENAYAGGARVRIESVQNAGDQAGVAVRNIMGERAVYDAVPWFWSNQYELRLQTAGLARAHDQAVLRGDPGKRSFSVVYLRERQVVALDCVNATRDYVQGRALITKGVVVEPDRLVNPDIALKSLLPA